MQQSRVTDILRYWLRCIRYEEALSARPKAWRNDTQLPGLFSVNMREPTLGRAYFKLPLADIATLIDSPETPQIRAFDNEIAAFFESWLAARYRMPDRVDEGPEIMVTCPTMQLRFGDLAGLVRFNVSLSFGYEGGGDFIVPSRRERRSGRFPEPPTQVRIQRVIPEEGLPFFVDGRLLSRELITTREEIDALFEILSEHRAEDSTATGCLSALAAFLDGGEPAATADECLARLTGEMSRRLSSSPHGERCYPVGIVMDTGRVKTTWHLQRELLGIIDGKTRLRKQSVLTRYLTQKSGGGRQAPLMGLLNEQGLTPSQTTAAERFLGSHLTTVEGPPGTGKTTLVLHLAAHLLVHRIAAFVNTGVMPTELTVIASTNNRAVDNVIDGLLPITGSGGLPIAIRVGSRRVCQEVFAPRLRAVETQLQAMVAASKPLENDQRLTSTKADFSKTLAALDALTAPEEKRRNALAKQRKLENRLEQLRAELADDDPGPAIDPQNLFKATRLLERLENRLENLSARCEGKPGKRRRLKVERYYESKIEQLLERAKTTLSTVGIDGPLFEPPRETALPHRDALEKWEDAAETGLDRVVDELARLNEIKRRLERRARKRDIEQTLAGLHIPEAVAVDSMAVNRLKADLFNKALAVRDAYATCHAKSLLDAVQAACRTAEEQATLRYFSKRDKFEQLAAIFPLWGTTLLSMGNVFDPGEGVVHRVVIDEAGQCHPAYAVSALMRCSRAMILGDVHQLTPIFGLTAEDERPIFLEMVGDDSDALMDYRVFDKSVASVQRLAEQGAKSTVRLQDHFRCQRDIIGISNRLCGYHLTVHTPPRSRGNRAPFLDRPVQFVSVAGEQARLGGSWWNRAEAELLMDWLKAILNAGIAADDVAVITPYRGQLYQLRRTVAALGIPIETSTELLDDLTPTEPLKPAGLAIGTVHRFQGGERSIVLFSTVVTEPRSLTFLNQRVNLINVAVSRARDHLVVFGHAPTLERGRLSRLLLDDAETPVY